MRVINKTIYLALGVNMDGQKDLPPNPLWISFGDPKSDLHYHRGRVFEQHPSGSDQTAQGLRDRRA